MNNRILRDTFRFFDLLSDEEVSHFLKFCEFRSMPQAGILFSEGDHDNFVAFIVAGQVVVKKKSGLKGNYTVVGIFDQGSVVGELCLLTENSRSVTAQVREPTDLLILTSANFEKLLATSPALGLKLLKHIFLLITKRLTDSYDRIAAIF